MDFNKIQVLGEKIEKRYRSLNYNEDYFPELATKYLEDFEFDYQWSASEIASFVSSATSVPTHIFSNLPITVFSRREFYIEILNWTTSSTAIHQHAFSGAFKVLAGSSLHSHYSFERSSTVSADVLLGDVKCDSLETLTKGDVRVILPGEKLTHCLFHLDHPSATLVVRTHGHTRYAPQYTLYPDNLAINNRWIGGAPPVNYWKCFVNTALDVSYEDFLVLMNEELARVDYALLAAVSLQAIRHFKSEDDAQAYFDAVRSHHSAELVDALKSASDNAVKLKHLSIIRSSTNDSNIRFFIALLMNSPNRAMLYEVVRARHPNEDPNKTIAHWLTQLCANRADVAKQLLELAAKETGSNVFQLSSKISKNLPKDLSSDNRSDFFRMTLMEGSESDAHPNSDWFDSISRVRAIPELSGLFE